MNEKDILIDTEYVQLIDKYMNDDYVQLLKNIPHHDTNRFNHSLKVSYMSYKVCKKLDLNFESAAKAGLLHDLYFNQIHDFDSFSDRFRLFAKDHPEDALYNAESRFNLSPLEKNIIVSHMWPISNHIPKYREAFVVSIVDKLSSAVEFGTKANFKLSQYIGVGFLFLMVSIFK